jgi:SH3-like domain-containing protein
MKMMIKKLILISAVALPCALSSAAFGADMGTALKADSLRAEPFADAKTSGNINRGEALEIITKQGAWLKVKNKKNTGWVRILSVKRSAASVTSNSASDVLSMASGRAGTGNVVATTGVRGLSSEDLKSAKFNESEVKLMESQTQTSAQAREFATNGRLKSLSMSYLSAPKE